jgi:hypothetical protein
MCRVSNELEPQLVLYASDLMACGVNPPMNKTPKSCGNDADYVVDQGPANLGAKGNQRRLDKGIRIFLQSPAEHQKHSNPKASWLHRRRQTALWHI